jgi:hypothetical protein
VAAIIENPRAPDNLGDPTAALALIDHKYALHGMPALLQAVIGAAPDHDVREQALDISLELWRADPDRRGWGDSPSEVMTHVFTQSPEVPLGFYLDLFTWVERRSSDRSSLPLLLNCARSLLALEGFASWGRLGGSVSITHWQVGRGASEGGLKTLRHRVLTWLFGLLEHSGVAEMRAIYDALKSAASGSARHVGDTSGYGAASDLELIASHLKARAQRADAIEQDLIISLARKPRPWSIFSPRFASELERRFRTDDEAELHRLLMGRAESQHLLLDPKLRRAADKELTDRLRGAAPMLLRGGPKKALDRLATMVVQADAFSMNLASCLWWAGVDRVYGAVALCRLAARGVESRQLPERPYAWYIGQLLGGLFESGAPQARQILRSVTQSGSARTTGVLLEGFASLRRAGTARLTRRDLALAASALRTNFSGGPPTDTSFRCLRPFQERYAREVHDLALQLSGLVANDSFHTYVSALVLLLLDQSERAFSVLGDGELGQLTARLRDVPDLEDHWVGELMHEVANRDFARWLDIVHARLRKHKELLDAKQYGKYRPLPFHLEHCLPQSLTDGSVELGLRSVQDWLIELNPRGSFTDICYGLPEVFHEIDSRCATRGGSGLSVPAEKCLSEWMGSSVSEGKGNLQGVKLWGIGILLRSFDFTPELFKFLEPLIEKGEKPTRNRETIRDRIWRELYSAVGPSGVYSPSTEDYEAQVACYETASNMGGLKLRRFLEPLIAEAKQKVENYSYPHAEFE